MIYKISSCKIPNSLCIFEQEDNIGLKPVKTGQRTCSENVLIFSGWNINTRGDRIRNLRWMKCNTYILRNVLFLYQILLHTSSSYLGYQIPIEVVAEFSEGNIRLGCVHQCQDSAAMDVSLSVQEEFDWLTITTHKSTTQPSVTSQPEYCAFPSTKYSLFSHRRITLFPCLLLSNTIKQG